MPSKFSALSVSALAVLAVALVPVRSAYASTLDYTFSGVAAGTITGPGAGSFTNFSLSFIEDPTTVVNAGTGFYRLNNISGTFTEGSYTATLTGVTIVVNGNSGFDNVNFFNSLFDNGLGLQNNAALANYALATSVSTGTATGGNLETTLNSSGDGFSTTGGGEVEFTGVSSLAFNVTATPEPSTLLLLTSGLPGLALLRRRFLRA